MGPEMLTKRPRRTTKKKEEGLVERKGLDKAAAMRTWRSGW
jgi:hypothetical protein